MSAQIQPESIDFTNKKDPQEGQFLNGGVNDARFELFKKYYEHLKSKHTQKVCLFIRTLV